MSTTSNTSHSHLPAAINRRQSAVGVPCSDEPLQPALTHNPEESVLGGTPEYESLAQAALVQRDVDVTILRDFAVGLAKRGAALVKEQRKKLVAEDDLSAFATTKSSAVDPVTIVDKACEELLVNLISAQRPDDGIIGEEGAEKVTKSGVSWVIDPIDGTVNFMYGIEEFAVSVAAVVEDYCVAGAVINVADGTVYSAALGHGATVRRSSGRVQGLHVRSETNPALALVATGFGYGAQRRADQAGLLTTLLPRVRDIRRMGSAALDFCRVAEGTVDAYYEHGIKLWDGAAGAVIAMEAGAIVYLPPQLWQEGSDSGTHIVWACAGGLAPAFQRLLAEAAAY